MDRMLFDLAGPAILGWALLIFLPKWRVTRWLAESAVFPAYLAVLYVVGIVTVVREQGAGFMADFGSAEGVLGLLATEPVALVAWIHILAFDQVVGLMIYRDNMRHRIVPLPVQSLILVLTLMLGPVGFLGYWVARMARERSRLVGWGEEDQRPFSEPLEPVRYAAVVESRTVAGLVGELWAKERALVRVGIAGFALAAVCTAIAAINGSWQLGAEGRLLEAAKFDVALGIFVLTLALIVPFAGFSARRRRTWALTLVIAAIYNFGMENVQSWRGLDPRFSEIAGTPDRVLGAIFFLTALLIMWLFIEMTIAFFRRDALPDQPMLRVALQYAAAAAVLAFTVGIVMSLYTSGRTMNGAGNLMPIHAAGFHGLQALPLVALLLGWSQIDRGSGMRLVHTAGVGWLLLCGGLVIQAARGVPPETPSGALGLSVAGALLWGSALVLAWRGGVGMVVAKEP